MNTFVVVLICVGGYVLVCAFFPTGKHFWCSGTGKIYQPFSGRKKWARCGGCGGSGESVRLGRRLLGWFLGPYQ